MPYVYRETVQHGVWVDSYAWSDGSKSVSDPPSIADTEYLTAHDGGFQCGPGLLVRGKVVYYFPPAGTSETHAPYVVRYTPWVVCH